MSRRRVLQAQKALTQAYALTLGASTTLQDEGYTGVGDDLWLVAEELAALRNELLDPRKPPRARRI